MKTILFFVAVLTLCNSCSSNQTAEEYLANGNAKNKEGDYIGAIAHFTKAIELNPNHSGAYNNRGNAKKSLEDLRGAIADFSKAIELNPNLAVAYYNRGLVRRL